MHTSSKYIYTFTTTTTTSTTTITTSTTFPFLLSTLPIQHSTLYTHGQPSLDNNTKLEITTYESLVCALKYTKAGKATGENDMFMDSWKDIRVEGYSYLVFLFDFMYVYVRICSLTRFAVLY